MITVKIKTDKMVEAMPGIKFNEALVPYIQWRGLLHNLKPIVEGVCVDMSEAPPGALAGQTEDEP